MFALAVFPTTTFRLWKQGADWMVKFNRYVSYASRLGFQENWNITELQRVRQCLRKLQARRYICRQSRSKSVRDTATRIVTGRRSWHDRNRSLGGDFEHGDFRLSTLSCDSPGICCWNAQNHRTDTSVQGKTVNCWIKELRHRESLMQPLFTFTTRNHFYRLPSTDSP